MGRISTRYPLSSPFSFTLPAPSLRERGQAGDPPFSSTNLLLHLQIAIEHDGSTCLDRNVHALVAIANRAGALEL